MFVVEDGPPDGPVILLLHGFASSHHAWDRVVPLLADDFRVIRVDLPGHGRTGGPAAGADAQAALIREVLGQEVLGRGVPRGQQVDLTVVGHSFGADVAVALADDPRVARLVLVAQGPDYAAAHVPRLRVLTDRPRLLHRLFRLARAVLSVAGRVVGRHRHPLATLVAGVCRDLRATDPGMLRVVLMDRRETLARQPLDQRLRDTGTAALVVLGGRDRLYGDRSAARYRAAGARVEVIADGTHALPQQHPTALAALVRAAVEG